MSNRKFKIGFTLAEVLITLGIIGVVAAITIPALVSSYKDRVAVTKLRETQSIFAQAFKSIAAEGETANWFKNDYEQDNLAVMESLRKYIKITHECGFEDSEYVCFSEEQKYNNDLLTDIQDYGYKFILLNGVSVNIDFVLDTFQEGANVRWIYFDINASLPPNIYGQDVFTFMLQEPGDYDTQLADISFVPADDITTEVLNTGKIKK